MTRMTPQAPVRADLNITPFIDVLLVLLVIAMLSARVQAELRWQMAHRDPIAGAGPPPVVLELREDGTDILDGRVVARSALARTLRIAVDAGRIGALVVQTGPSRSYQDVITVMSVARDAGVRTIGLAP